MNDKAVTPTYTIKRLDAVIAEHVEHALTLYGWNMTRAADALNVDRRTLYRMISRHKLKRPAELPPETRATCGTCEKLAPETDPPAEPGMVWFCSPECAKSQGNVPPAVEP